MARVVVSGYAVRYPLGGMLWAHLHYVVGLHRLGHEVWFVEDAGWDDSCYDPDLGEMTSDPSFGLSVVGEVMERLALADRWGYRDGVGRWHGLDGASVADIIASADLFLDVGGASYFDAMRAARRRAYVDMDPVFTQLGRFGGEKRLAEYDVLFTYGWNIGRGAAIETGPFHWRPLAPPVVLDLWQNGDASEAEGTRWTTVGSLTAYGAVEHDGERYGQKDTEFLRLADLPTLTSCELELAANPDGEAEAALVAGGWHVVDASAVSRDPWRYRDYVRRSRGELSAAKGAYVKARAGWLSDRTATYLAAGRPAVVQDTGIPRELVAEGGLAVFDTAEAAAAALGRMEANYDAECRAARALAERHFDARTVLEGLLADAL